MANNYLKLGSQGDWVSKLQTELNAKGGYGLAVDGIYGEKTEAAIKDYQGKQGLDIDGIVGPETWGVLMHGYDNPFVTTSTPSSNSGATNNATSTSKAPTLEPAPTKPTSTYTPYGDTTEGQGKNDIVEKALAYLNSLGDFNWKDQTKYDEYIKQWEERPDFSYNFNEDALYQQYKDQYMKQGKMAMMDTMGQASAMTGGYGNSYAQMVGQQAYNAQLENLNDVIPELYGMALDKYQMEGQDLLNTIGLLGNERDYELGLYKDDYAKRLEAYSIANDDYYNSANMYTTEQNNINSLAQQDWQNAMAIWEANNTNAWNQAQYDESVRQFNEQMEFQKKQYEDSLKTYSSGGSSSGGSSGGSTGGSGSGSTGSGSGNGGNTGANVGSTTTVPDAIKDKASSFTNNDALNDYLTKQYQAGKITKEQMGELYIENEISSLQNRNWTVNVKDGKKQDGGINWFWGIDNNAEVKDQYGNTYTLSKLVDALVAEGMDKSKAKDYVKKLQKQLGI